VVISLALQTLIVAVAARLTSELVVSVSRRAIARLRSSRRRAGAVHPVTIVSEQSLRTARSVVQKITYVRVRRGLLTNSRKDTPVDLGDLDRAILLNDGKHRSTHLPQPTPSTWLCGRRHSRQTVRVRYSEESPQRDGRV
jgi:hypothetical protein